MIVGAPRAAWMLAAAAALAGAGGGCGKTAPPRRPNLVVIVADDQGWADVGAQQAARDVRTPHLDALAADGVRFTRAYVTAPQCVPSRAGLLTGRYQTRFGVETSGSGPLPLGEATIADALRAAGYRTGMVGKWHLDGGRGPAYAPGRRGFDEYWNGMTLTYEASYDLQGRTLADAPRTIRDERHRTDVQTDAALAFLDRRRERPAEPFFLYVAYFAPHVPLDRPERHLARFAHVTDETRRLGLAAIAAMDEGVGRIRAHLRAQGLERDTLVLFLSDNGAPVRREAWDGSLNAPMVGEKGMLTDGGVRVPFLAAWPGTLPRGRVEERAVSALDVAATARALSGQPADPRLDGVDLLPFLTGRRSGPVHELLYWRWRSQAAVFDGRFKLIALPPDRSLLFDHAADAPETADVSARHPEVVAALRRRLEAWAAEQQPPGLPRELTPNDRALYDDHYDLFPGAHRRRGHGVAAPGAAPPADRTTR